MDKFDIMVFNGKYERCFGMKKNTKRKKWQFYTSIGTASVVIVGAMGILLFRQPSQAAVKDAPSHLVVAKEGTVASSILLSGTVMYTLVEVWVRLKKF